MNFLATIIAAMVPLVIGMVYYNPKILGNVWMKESGLDEEKLKGAKMPVIFIFTLIFSFMASVFMHSVVIHQMGVGGALFNDLKEGAEPARMEKAIEIKALFAKTGEALDMEGKIKADADGMFASNHRSFGHGFLHGGILSIFLILPILAINALFERRSWKYIFIHLGYWFISLGLMGGIIGQWA